MLMQPRFDCRIQERIAYGKQIISELSEILDKQTSANIFHCFYQAEDLLSRV